MSDKVMLIISTLNVMGKSCSLLTFVDTVWLCHYFSQVSKLSSFIRVNYSSFSCMPSVLVINV